MPAVASHHRPICSPLIVANRVRVLLGSYRKGDADDPEIYTTAVAKVLSGYPEAVVILVTDPETGLPGRSQWLPTVFEVRHACELAMKPFYEEARRKNQQARIEQLGEFEQKSARLTFEQLREQYPDIVGHSLPRRTFDQKKILAELEARKPALSAPLEISEALRHTNALRTAALLNAGQDGGDL